MFQRFGSLPAVGLLPSIAVLVAVVLSSCGSSSVTSSSTTTQPTTTVVPAPNGVHVVHVGSASPYLADATGHAVLLRGVNDNALVEYATNYPEAPSIARSDFTEMAALGFNFLRLPVSWSRIMPEPGILDRSYLDEVARVVGWARSNGIGVLVDMHEDNFSRVSDPGSEADGAPQWADIYDGTPCTPISSTTNCSLAAFKNFWANTSVAGKPIQTWYLEAMTAVAKAAGATDPKGSIVGVELMNEPWPSGPSPFETQSLYPFYNRMIAGLRTAGVVTPLWFEPSLIRNVTDTAVATAARFSTDDDLVYAVHIYTGVFSPPFSPTASQPVMHASYDHAAQEAAVFGTPFVVDEYGSSPKPAWNSWLTAQIGQQDAYGVGSAFWLWKQRTGKWDNWATVLLDGSLRSTTLRAQILSQPHVDSVPGSLTATTATSTALNATVDGPGGTATVWGGTVVVHGGPTSTTSTLRKVAIGGTPVRATCRMLSFETPTTHLTGCQLSFAVPAGHQVIEITP